VPQPLISADALAELLDRSAGQVSVLDVRWDLASGPTREDYLSGHIPGAVFVDLDAELAAPSGPGGRHPLPTAEAFAASMRTAGLWNQNPVVVYDAANGIAAARAWWLLRYFGHPGVSVLDGGLRAWLAAGLPVETGAPHIERGDFVARPGGMPLLDASAAAQVASHGVLIDARANERFRGEREPIDSVAGHVPGAVNRPTSENLDASGRFRAGDQLRAEFAGVGAADGVPIGAYCGSGIAAAQEVLALELAGYPAALYVGSWSDWITDPTRPIGTGQD